MNNEYTCGLQVLDADNGRRLESSTGRVATRDMVQFVPMREVQSKYQLLLKLTCLWFNSLAYFGPSKFCTHFIPFKVKCTLMCFWQVGRYPLCELFWKNYLINFCLLCEAGALTHCLPISQKHPLPPCNRFLNSCTSGRRISEDVIWFVAGNQWPKSLSAKQVGMFWNLLVDVNCK